MKRVIAQGTFDIIHTGHVHYLSEAASLGDELYVIVARRDNVTHKAKPILPDRQRRDLLAALSVVDQALIGHSEDIFVPVEKIDPDVIVLGHDQHHNEAAIEDELERRGIECEVRRASPLEPTYEGELLSTGKIINRICDERC